MLNTLPIAKPMGFTLIEMMVVVAIIIIATTLGLPSYRIWVQNTQIRNVAESIQDGMQRARAEAVKRNASIEFVLGVGASHLVQNPLWKIEPAGTSSIIEASTIEGAKTVTATTTPSDSTTITFNGLGTVGLSSNNSLNSDGTSPLTQIDVDSSTLSAADSRNLSVMIGTGGNIRMCDPDPGLSASDPRRC